MPTTIPANVGVPHRLHGRSLLNATNDAEPADVTRKSDGKPS
jgi:hypothetical protein